MGQTASAFWILSNQKRMNFYLHTLGNTGHLETKMEF